MNGTVQRVATFDFYAVLAHYTADSKLATHCAGLPASRGLGLADWLVASLEATDLTKGNTFKQIEYTVEFKVSRNVSGGITFKTSIVELKLNSPSAKYDNTNKLVVTIVSAPPPNTFTLMQRVGGDEGDIPSDVRTLIDSNIRRLTEEKKPEIVLQPGDTFVVQ